MAEGRDQIRRLTRGGAWDDAGPAGAPGRIASATRCIANKATISAGSHGETHIAVEMRVHGKTKWSR